jgi:cell division protein FtsW
VEITSKNSYASSPDFPLLGRRRSFAPRPLDKGFLLVLFTLLALGLVQVYSASFILAEESYGDGLYFFKKQLVFAALSVLALGIASRIKLRWIEKFGLWIWVAAVVGIVATFVPGIGSRAGGAARWIHFSGVRFEPSELYKVSLPFALAFFLSREESPFGKWKWPVRVLILAAPMVILLRQPDFGTVVICTTVILATFFCFGLRGRYILALMAGAVPLFYALVINVPYRYARLMAFINPWRDPDRGGFQMIQSMMGLYSGGLTGTGLGQGMAKLFFLPEAHTDFTLAVLGEELGFAGVVVVLLLYGYLVFKGIQTSIHAPTPFTRVTALGITIAFALQVMINVGVVMGMLPPKGLTLPFLSYGGSSLVVTGFAFGILLNIRRYSLGR